MKTKNILFGSLLICSLGACLFAFKPVSRQSTMKKVEASSVVTATTDFALDCANVDTSFGYPFIGYYVNISSGNYNAVSVNNTNIAAYTLKTPTYYEISLKSYSDHNVDLGLMCRVTSGSDGCTGGYVSYTKNGTSTYNGYSSGNGAKVTLGAHDVATFRVYLTGTMCTQYRIIPALGYKSELLGAFAILSWYTFDADPSVNDLVETNYTISAGSGTNYEFTVKTVDADYKNLAPSGKTFSGVKGEVINFYSGEGAHSYSNPDSAYEIDVYGSHNGTYFRDHSGESIPRFYLGYGTAVGDTGSTFIIAPKIFSYKLNSVTLNNHPNVNLVDVWQYSSSDDGINWSEPASLSWTGSGNNKTTTINFANQTSFVKIIHSGAIRNVTALGSVSISYAESSYCLSFDSDGGTTVEPQYIPIGSSDVTVEPIAPTKANSGLTKYVFGGWFTEPNGKGTEFEFGHTLSDNVTIYAYWNETQITKYTATFETFGGTSIASQSVSADAPVAFTKPADPTKVSDGVYNYTFHKWYANPEMTIEYKFTEIPDGDVTIYAGFQKSAMKPSGSTTVDPKNKISTWGSELTSYSAWDIDTKTTFATSNSIPAMRFTATSVGENSGAKNKDNSQVRVNNTTVTLRITDKTKYFSIARFEFYVATYNASASKLITLSTGGVVCDSGYSPYNSTNNSDLVLIGDCSGKPNEFTFSVGNIGAEGVRLRYLYLAFGTYTDEEQAINYAKAFNDDHVCGTTDTSGLDTSKWEAQAAEFDALSSDSVRAVLQNYSGSNVEILEMLERYDRVIYLHGADYDFMGRIESANIEARSSANVFGTIQTNSISLIIVIAVSSVLLLGFYLIIRKKEQ